ncbi:hypothetical protein SY83_20435 [Paenibacillus swuensis]|uniref:Uncharacterized protein n=1 Tax=Paenibacillus swuensis TaxID=1178515 RepID=A0A172TMQ4_9BACL|nr:hypothetical protein [Paenibacillus swuensis]ANE48262.1 hypothetical protein SY83_20435 [Paenibacillus swuensis]
MERECIVHFEVKHQEPQEVKHLHGLLYVDGKREPTVDELTGCLQACGFDVRPDRPEKLTFKPTLPGEDDYRIRITNLDFGDQEEEQNNEVLRQLAKNFVRREPEL